jgi:hypothetical protein
MLQDKGLAGAVVSREQVFAQLIELAGLVRRLLSRDACGPIMVRPTQGVSSQNIGIERLGENRLEIGRLCQLRQTGGAFGPVTVPRIALWRQLEFDDLAPGSKDLIGTFVEEVLGGQIVLAIDVCDAKHIHRVSLGRQHASRRAQETKSKGKDTRATRTPRPQRMAHPWMIQFHRPMVSRQTPRFPS